MAPPPDSTAPSLLDDRLSEVGAAGVVAAIEDIRRRVGDGSLPGFTDAHALAEHWEARQAHKA